MTVNELADIFSKRKAKGKSRLQIPKALGETHAFFITAPLIDMVIQKIKEIKNASYEEGAVGVRFDRNKDFHQLARQENRFPKNNSPPSGRALHSQ